jgi:hypothetical protein
MAFIKQTEIKMHNKEETHFGVFQIELEKVEITKTHQLINLMLDNSGSMDENCNDGNTKMAQIKHVANNILRYITKHCVDRNVMVSVNTFNMEVANIFNGEIVSEENVHDLITKIGKIYAIDGTNIEVALKTMTTDLECGVKVNNIFMSDGEATAGEYDPPTLAKLVDEIAENTFIGFGLDHNPRLFAALGATKNSSYYFIDKMEESGKAYGEILHGILYRCLNGVHIRIENGTIYNWKTNEWLSEIYVGNMSSEMKKTFHIMSENKDSVRITVEGKDETGQPIVSTCVFQGQTEDLQKMLYRQRTQELLFKANHVAIENREEKISELKHEMKDFVKVMKDYMDANDLKTDSLLNNLCDDIVVVYRTLGTRFGYMFTCSRQTTQGDERMHNVSETPRNDMRVACSGLSSPRKMKFGRSMLPNNVFIPNEDYDIIDEESDNNIINSHVLTINTPYHRSQTAEVAASISSYYISDTDSSDDAK